MPVGAPVVVNQAVRHKKSGGGSDPADGQSKPLMMSAHMRKMQLELEKEQQMLLLKSDNRLQEAQASAAIIALRQSRYSTVTLNDVKELLRMLGCDNKMASSSSVASTGGLIRVPSGGFGLGSVASAPVCIDQNRWRTLMTAVLQPNLTNEEAQKLWELSDKAPDGTVSAETVHKSMTQGAIKQILREIEKEQKTPASKQDGTPTVTRDLLKYWIAERKLQDLAIENWVVGWSKDWGGPYLLDHVTSVPYFYVWLQDSAMPCLFSDARRNDEGSLFVHMASAQIIIGDAKLTKVPPDGGDEEEAWLLDSVTGELAPKHFFNSRAGNNQFASTTIAPTTTTSAGNNQSASTTIAPNTTTAAGNNQSSSTTIAPTTTTAVQDMQLVFASFDDDKSGSLEPKEVEKAFNLLKFDLTLASTRGSYLTDAFNMLDEDGNGFLDFAEFSNLIHKVYQIAAQKRLTELHDNGFFDREAQEIRLDWCTYNSRSRMFSLNRIHVEFRDAGFIVPSMSASAVLVEPYPRHQIVRCVFIWALVGLYVLLILLPLRDELKEICISLKSGCKGFINYWGIWNAVDWCTIMMGIAQGVTWVTCCQSMRQDSIQNLMGNDFKLSSTVMELRPDDIQQILDDLDRVSMWFFSLQIMMAANVVTILLKMFKAFQSNARLSVVTDTLIVAAVDITHFLIVFMAIFLGFAMMAHVLFGNDLSEFESLLTSMQTSFNVLMGEFGWYVDFQMSPGMASGMPRAVLTTWYFAFQIFVLLCLLNMLLAVILERYAQVSDALEGSDEAPTLWVQVGRYFERRKATKGFLPLLSVATDLERTGSQMVHPNEDEVTQESLLEAFPSMKEEQAKWLMKYLVKEAKKNMPKEDIEGLETKLTEIQAFVQYIADELHLVQISTNACNKKVDRMVMENSNNSDDAQNDLTKAEPLFEEFGAQLLDQARATDELRTMMQELVSTASRLSAKAAVQSMPEEKMKDTSRSTGPRTLPPCCATEMLYSGRAGSAPRGPAFSAPRGGAFA